MPLFLFELTVAPAERTTVNALLDEVGKAAADVGGDLIESQVTAGLDRVFAIVEASGAAVLAEAVTGATVPSAAGISGPGEVRLLRADLAVAKAARAPLPSASRTAGPDNVRLDGAALPSLRAACPHAGCLVEWAPRLEMDMET